MQRKLLQDAFDSLVIPEANAALNAGELLESLGLVWEKATLEDKHRLLAGMLGASSRPCSISFHSWNLA